MLHQADSHSSQYAVGPPDPPTLKVSELRRQAHPGGTPPDGTEESASTSGEGSQPSPFDRYEITYKEPDVWTAQILHVFESKDENHRNDVAEREPNDQAWATAPGQNFLSGLAVLENLLENYIQSITILHSCELQTMACLPNSCSEMGIVLLAVQSKIVPG